MRKFIVGAIVLALVAVTAGCQKTTLPVKQSEKPAQPAAADIGEKPNSTVEHQVMKPVTPATGTQRETPVEQTQPGTETTVTQTETTPESKLETGTEEKEAEVREPVPAPENSTLPDESEPASGEER